ncbi:MAG: hypothetical protein L0211_09130 [Planctomycetaceae bacterium]|nr:hypothetical protein [Planctomycetaceae bacterium]
MDVPASTILDNWLKQRRPAPFFNTTDETVPPFACMYKMRLDRFSETTVMTKEEIDDPVGKVSRFFRQYNRGGHAVWTITKPNDQAEAEQNSSDFLFNGPVPVPSLRHGVGTEDFPCQVLHDGTKDLLSNGDPCGPVADQWYVKSGGSAFISVCHDALAAAGQGGVHTVWISNGNGKALSAHGRWELSSLSVAASDYVPWSTGSVVKGLEIQSDQWLKVLRAGIFWLGFQAKVSSVAAPRGAPLSVTLYKKPIAQGQKEPGEATATMYIGQRDQDIERDNYGVEFQKTAENVAFSGFENLKRGELLRLRNASAHDIVLGSGTFSIIMAGSYFRTETISGGGLVFDSN